MSSFAPQLLSNQQVLNYMDQVRQKQGKYRKYPFSNRGVGYSQNDPNCFPMGDGLAYNENVIFGSPANFDLSTLPNSSSLVNLNQTIQQQTAATNAANGTTGATAAPGAAPGPYNYSVTPFAAGALSLQVLPYNPRRQALLIQNQDPANTLFFNLGQGAGANQGILLQPTFGLLWEIKVPSNYVTVFSAAGARGVACEGM